MARAHLSLVPDAPAGYGIIWHAATPGMHGACCMWCARAIGVDKDLAGKRVACVYCGLHRGDLPEVEIEPFEDDYGRSFA